MTAWVRLRTLAGALALASVAVLGGCGISADGLPHPVDLPPPYGDLASTPAPNPTTNEGRLTEVLYLIRDGALVAVTRPVDTPPPPMTLLDNLAAGPTAAEQAQGLVSALTSGTAVVDGVQIVGGLATVALTDTGLEGLTGATQLLAIAQIVCTLDARDDVTGVVFARGGQRFPVPRGDGSQADAELTMSDYQSLIEP